MEKYAHEAQPGAKKKKIKQSPRRNITKAQHDRIWVLYHTGQATGAELASRFGYSPALVSQIVNGLHTHNK